MTNDTKEKWMSYLVHIAALLSVCSVLLIGAFVFVQGVPPIGTIGIHEFFGGTEWRPGDEPPAYGIFPMIIGTLAVTLGALVMGGPIALGGAVCLAYFVPKSWQGFLRSMVLLLAGIPSIVYGFFGMVVLVPLVREYGSGTGNALFTAALLLGMMILPTILSVSEAALTAIPYRYYEAGRGLGLTHERTVMGVMVPAASGGILAAVVLGIGRAVGETMAVIMVAGNQAIIPTGIWDGVRTLTANIVLEMGYATDLHRDALVATGAVLFAIILIINSLFLYLRHKWVKPYE